MAGHKVARNLLAQEPGRENRDATAAGTPKMAKARAERLEQQAALATLAGLASREIAVLTVVQYLAAVYDLQASNDPKMISGHIAGLGQAAVRNTLESLVETGRLWRTEAGTLVLAEARHAD